MLTQAQHRADHDGLTEALSRSAFRRQLEERTALGSVTVLLLDLDDFGIVNKTRGHAAGDDLLRIACARMEGALRTGDILGRLGGDEFAILATTTDPFGLAQRVRSALQGDAGDSPIPATIGIAGSPDHGSDAESLLRAADVAQRMAKREGKGSVKRYEGPSLTSGGPHGAMGALTRMITGDGIHMHVQPIVDVSRGEVHAYEALARFRSRTVESPLHWLALAEEYGMRNDLEIACLRAAVRLVDTCPGTARLSVNLSARLLGDPRVGEVLSGTKTPGRLIIEITEDSLVGDPVSVAAALAPILRRGIALAVDDVGAGYSGLQQIARLRPTYLKVDRSLVEDIDVSDERAALLEALVGYAQRTGSILIAEGVETNAQLACLRALGVAYIQGFLLSRPGPPWPEVAWPASAPALSK
jgi:diguanylate cyclase (GGDEF)-like protein